jgi:hypothetical protein
MESVDEFPGQYFFCGSGFRFDALPYARFSPAGLNWLFTVIFRRRTLMSNGGGGRSAGVGVWGFGSMLSITLSWSVHHSILWMIVHGIFSWFYVGYYAWMK